MSKREIICLRISSDEKKLIKYAADQLGMSVSQYLRHCAVVAAKKPSTYRVVTNVTAGAVSSRIRA